MQSSLVLTLFGSDRSGLIKSLSEVVKSHHLKNIVTLCGFG